MQLELNPLKRSYKVIGLRNTLNTVISQVEQIFDSYEEAKIQAIQWEKQNFIVMFEYCPGGVDSHGRELLEKIKEKYG